MLPDPSHPVGRRVGYVTKMYPRFSETFVLTELLHMQALGVDVEVFSLRLPTDGRFHAGLADLRAPVTYLTSAGIRAADLWDTLRAAAAELRDLERHLAELLRLDVRDALQSVELAVQVRRRGITHLHAHFASVGTSVARTAARLAGITYSFTAHAKDIFHDQVDPADLRRKLRDAADVVTVSDFNLDHLRRTFGLDAARVRRVYNGLDLRAFPWSSPAGRPPVVAAVGRLVEKKGFDDLLDAVALLNDRGRPVELVLVGTGAEEPALRAQVDRLGLASRVRLTGALPQAEVARVVAGAAVFAAPAWWGPTATATACPRLCWRRWPSAPRAWPPRSPASRRRSSTR